MYYSKIKNTDIIASKLVLGTDGLGTELDERESFEMLDTYVSYGGNVIDTASVYADWLTDVKSMSEKTIGKWLSLRGCRDKVVLSTKGGHPRIPTMRISRLSREDV